MSSDLAEALQIARELFWAAYPTLTPRQRAEALERLQALDGTDSLMIVEDIDALYGEDNG